MRPPVEMNERDRGRPAGKQNIYEGVFDYTLPRPPALGEERKSSASERGAQQMDRIGTTKQYHHQQQKSSSPIPKIGYDVDEEYRPNSRHGRAGASSPPACFSWAQSLHNLLQDTDGVKTFLRYLESEGPHHADTLSFWLACEGLKKHDQVENIQRLVKLIYKTYFLKSALPINDELRKQIMKNMKSPQCLEPPITLFDEAQAQIESWINKTTYPNFLKSDVYLQHLQAAESDESSSCSSSMSNREANIAGGALGPLPTLHEDMEYSTGYHTPTVRLTKDLLLRSQKHRALDIRPKSETYAGMMYRSTGAHVAYNSYNPVSRQDSEMQSLSSHSDVRTDSDSFSLNESSIDGRSGRSCRKSIEQKQMRQIAARNKETNMNHPFIPRTQRIDMMNGCLPMQEHAALLTQKLENLKREQESQELLQRRLKESDSMGSLETRELETAIREKLQFQDDNDQNILDEHVSRVFSDHSLSVSPCLASPKVPSPPRGRWSQARPRRRDKDLFSTFSSDSGNVHDFSDEHKSITKSKSIPECGDERFSRASAFRRSATKKTSADLTDSGVSVVSDSASVGVVPPAKDSRVLTWLQEADRSGRVGGSHAHSEMAVREGVGRKYRKYGSRSNSLERNTVAGPAQPFIADPSMPPLPFPNTDIQLEEIRRRLTEDDLRTKSRQKLSNKYYPEVAVSGPSTLRKSTRRPNPPSNEDVTIVVFSFCDEEFPYRTKIAGTQVTLKQFKEILPKKGNYRFFFKTVCEDLSNQVTHEEVSSDSDVLPLWEGKIMAQVKPVD